MCSKKKRKKCNARNSPASTTPPPPSASNSSQTNDFHLQLIRRRWLGFKLQVRQAYWVKYHQLSMEERYELAAMRPQGLRMAAMANILGAS
jgi:Helix-turn-helix domain